MARFLGELLVVVLGLISSGGWAQEEKKETWRIHTLFSVECQNYFDWQTVGLMHSYKKAQQPGPITRLLSCTDEEKKNYRGMNLAPTFEVPSMSKHPKTGDWYFLFYYFYFFFSFLFLVSKKVNYGCIALYCDDEFMNIKNVIGWNLLCSGLTFNCFFFGWIVSLFGTCISTCVFLLTIWRGLHLSRI